MRRHFLSLRVEHAWGSALAASFGSRGHLNTIWRCHAGLYSINWAFIELTG